MAYHFQSMDLAQLYDAAEAIGLNLKPGLKNNQEALSESLEFHYRWRNELSDIALKAGGMEPSEVPELPYDAERIQECLIQLQPKIRRNKRKRWGWFGLLLLLPVVGAVQCVRVNQNLLDAQTVLVKEELEQLQTITLSLGWSVDVPDTPTWSDVTTAEANIEEDRRLAQQMINVTQVAESLGYSIHHIRPYTDAQVGDYSLWMDLVQTEDHPIPPFAMRTVPLTVFSVSDTQIDRQFNLTHALTVMSRTVDTGLWALGDAKDAPEHKDTTVQVSWGQAIAFANLMSQREELEVCYMIQNNVWQWENEDCNGFRLPTELELIQLYRSNTDENSKSYIWEWAWDMYDPSWLWNMPKGTQNPRIDRVNMANPTHVMRLGPSKRRSSGGEKAAFRLVRTIQENR